MVLTIMIVSLAVSMYAAKVTEGFEDKTILKNWEIEGDVAISGGQKHSGKSALFVPAGAKAILRFGAENKYGTVTIWVYDSYVNNKKNKPGKEWNGPYFGLINSDDDKAVEILAWKTWLSVLNYNQVFTAENQWFSIGWSGLKRPEAAAWSKFTFTFPNDKTLGLTFNDEKEVNGWPEKIEFFNKGANGIVFGGGQDIKDKNETFYYDDIEIDVKDAAKAK